MGIRPLGFGSGSRTQGCRSKQKNSSKALASAVLAQATHPTLRPPDYLWAAMSRRKPRKVAKNWPGWPENSLLKTFFQQAVNTFTIVFSSRLGDALASSYYWAYQDSPPGFERERYVRDCLIHYELPRVGLFDQFMPPNRGVEKSKIMGNIKRPTQPNSPGAAIPYGQGTL